MRNSTTLRRADSQEALDRLLAGIEAGRRPKPDWIDLRGRGRLVELAPDVRKAQLARLHRCVRRGFRSPSPGLGRESRLALWRSIARGGFHDFAGDGFSKCYDSPFVESYDYLGDYLAGGLDALDPYRVYSAILGTHDYGVEDLVATELCRKVRTVVEPMAGSAEFAYKGHFRFPDFRYLMFDLDRNARDHVLARNWLPQTEHRYWIADVLDERIWQQVKSLSSGESLCYIGKQSHQFFGAKDLLRLLELATLHVDYFVLEVTRPVIVSDLETVEDLTRPEMRDAGFEVAMVDLEDRPANPITNRMGFRLEARDDRQRRVFFEYPQWISWQLPMLATLAELLDLRVTYFHSEEEQFVPIADGTAEADLLDNETFMLFSRRS